MQDFDEKFRGYLLPDISIIRYGIIYGNNTIVFIKGGQDCSLYGYQNKYLKMAHNIHDKYGYTVIVSSNPFNGENPLDNAMKVVHKVVEKCHFKDYQIYYMGLSNGAIVGAWYGVNYSKIKRMLLINPPLDVYWDITKEGIEKFQGERMNIVFGNKDPSYSYTPLIKEIKNEKVHLHIIEGEDHCFSTDAYDFERLPMEFLLND